MSPLVILSQGQNNCLLPAIAIMDSMEYQLLAEKQSRQSPEHSILVSVQQILRGKIKPQSSFNFLGDIGLDDGTCLTIVSVKEELNQPSLILMCTISEKIEISEQPTALLGRSTTEVTCGTFAKTAIGLLFAIGGADGSVILSSTEVPNNVLAKLDNDSRNRPVLKIIQDTHPADNNMVCFWVAYSDSVKQIACNVTEGRIVQFVETLVLKFDKNDFSTFHSFEVTIFLLCAPNLICTNLEYRSSC